MPHHFSVAQACWRSAYSVGQLPCSGVRPQRLRSERARCSAASRLPECSGPTSPNAREVTAGEVSAANCARSSTIVRRTLGWPRLEVLAPKRRHGCVAKLTFDKFTAASVERTQKPYVFPYTGTTAPRVTRFSGDARNRIVAATSYTFGQAAWSALGMA